MKSYLIALVDRLLPKIGLVRLVHYRGLESWANFLDSLASQALELRCAHSTPAKKVRKRAVKG